MASGEPVFALDIGTRTIVGLLLVPTKQGYQIKAAQIEEHQNRAMFQGQIHDIEAVAATVARIKSALEKRTGRQLHRAAVAAAGRALETCRGKAQQKLDPSQPVSRAQVQALELEAVRYAQGQLAGKKEGDRSYFCVGYSIFRYYLEKEPISSLIGQRGGEIALEVIATFLPRVVVDSLLAVLEAANLEVLTLTLEPIAALNVALSPGMRNLNLALVDIGAGTSDIALSRGGTIFAYAMVPRAGDEVTEALCSTYLLEFKEGEELKRCLKGQERVEFTDILGNNNSVPTAEAVAALEPTVSQLAQEIGATILDLNGRPPDGVILVGGGSLTPQLPEKLAQCLGLSPKRVGIRARDSLPEIKGQPRKLSGPEAITPIGIGVWALSSPPFTYRRVYVNDSPLQLWNLEETTVSAALLAAGTKWERLHGRPGQALTIEVNGQVQIFKGQLGKPAQVLVNSQEADLATPLKDGDRVQFVPPRDGEDALVNLRALLPSRAESLEVNGQDIPLSPRVFLNGEEVKDLDTPVPDRARVEITWHQPLEGILGQLELSQEELSPQVFTYTLNGKMGELTWPRYLLEVNQRPAGLETPVGPGDVVTYQKNPEKPTLGEILPPGKEQLELTLNGKPFLLPWPRTITLDGKPSQMSTPLSSRAVISYQEQAQPLLADLFRYYDPRQEALGTKLILRVNDRPADFTTPLKEGDRIDILLEKVKKVSPK